MRGEWRVWDAPGPFHVMPTTLDYFTASNGSRAFAHTSQPGRIPLAQIVAAMDTLACIHTTCAHVLDGNGSDVALYDPPMDRIRQNSKLTIPQCQRIIRAWEKWVWHVAYLENGIPKLSTVINFLHDEALKA